MSAANPLGASTRHLASLGRAHARLDGALARAATWRAVALLVPVLVCAFHWRAARPGMAFVGADLRYFFFGIREATAEALRQGDLPGWQRGIFLGYPLIGDPQSAVFDLATWLTLPWDAPRALTLAALLHLCIGGWGAAFWMRTRGLSPAAGLLAAVLFSLGAKQTVHLQHWIFAASCAWWPWMLAGLDGFARQGRGRYLLLTALASACSWFGGAAQMAYFGTLVAGAHALVLAPSLWRRRPADALLALASAPLGLLLAGPMFLPVRELASLGPRGAGVDYAFATSWKWPSRWGFALFVLPRAYGGGWRLSEMNLWEATGYLGLLPLGLAAAVSLVRRGIWHFTLLAVVSVWLCFGEDSWLGLHRLFFEWLPGYGSFRNPTRSLMVTSLLSAVIAAEGLEALRAPAPDARDRAWRRLAIRAAWVLALLGAAALVIPTLKGFPLHQERAIANGRVAAGLVLVALLWLAAAARFPRARSGAAWGLAAAALAFTDLYLAFGDPGPAFSDVNPVARAADERPPLSDLAAIVPEAPEPRRIAVIAKWGQSANAALRLGWEGTTGYGPTVIQRVRALLEATRSDTLVPLGPVTSDTNFPRPRPESPLWPLLATPLVVTDAPRPLLTRIGAAAREWEQPFEVSSARALPRVYWTSRWEARADEEVAGALLRAAAGGAAVVAQEDAAPLGPPAAGMPAVAPVGADPGSIDASSTEAREPSPPLAAERVSALGGRVEATLVAPAPGLAVILDPWFPGWSATVDGAPARLVRANYAFMAVPVAAGRHELALTYRNTQVGRGFLLAGATLAALLAALAWRRRGTARIRRSDERPTCSTSA